MDGWNDRLACYICMCVYLQVDPWVTKDGTDPLPLEEEHCTMVEVTEEEVQNSVKFVPSLSAVVSETEQAQGRLCIKYTSY